MEYLTATEQDVINIWQLVQNSIKTVYPKYYPKEVVDFFCALHSKENIEKDIRNSNVGKLLCDNIIVGTGSNFQNHITRLYVEPDFQNRGYGSYIMKCLEDTIFLSYDFCILDASLPACHMYEKRGYKTLKHEKYQVENGAVLVYEVMEKIKVSNEVIK